MKPQQQNTDAKSESAVYVQTPEGKEIDVKANRSASEKGKDDAGRQTAENVPTKSSSEVTDGEDA